MNKYQEALNELCSRCYVESEKCTCHPKYKGGKCNNNCEHKQALQELIDKEETPMKPKVIWQSDVLDRERYRVHLCPKCNCHLGFDDCYCRLCGQRVGDECE